MRSILIQKTINLFWHLPLSMYANIRYKFPGRNLIIIGVTGTDGKTTVTNLIHFLLLESGKKVGSISTINAKYSGSEIDIGLHVTTPAHQGIREMINPLVHLHLIKFIQSIISPEGVHKYLAYLKKNGAEYVVVESTSQGLDQYRLFGIKFDEAVYTNIREDHLDYHITKERYMKAKARLIKLTKKNSTVIINGDDESWKYLKEITEINHKTFFLYSLGLVKNIKNSIEGLSFTINGNTFKSKLIGTYNISNILASIYACSKYITMDEMSLSLLKFKPPEGRMEVLCKDPFAVIVDFAHTPSSLKSALVALNEVKDKKGRIISVFGCAGKRDKQRRAMGGVSAKYGNITVITSEDPRDEKVSDINDEILKSAQDEGGCLRLRFKNHEEYKTFTISDNIENGDCIIFDEDSLQGRIDAIDFALRMAKPCDVILLTGKGHEKSLAFGDKEFDWNEQEVTTNLLNKYLKS